MGCSVSYLPNWFQVADHFFGTFTGDCLVLLPPDLLTPPSTSSLQKSFMRQPRRIFHIPTSSRRWFSNNFFRFCQTARDRFICCRPLMTPDGSELTVVFQALAYVSPHDCFLTLQGDSPFLGPNSDPTGCTGSCWLEPCNNPISRDQWRRMQQNILELKEATQRRLGVTIHLPFMYRPLHSVPYIFSMQVGTSFNTADKVSQLHFTFCSFEHSYFLLLIG